MTKNQWEKAAKYPFVCVSFLKMLRKHFSRLVISAQIIGSSVYFLPRVTVQGSGLLQQVDQQV